MSSTQQLHHKQMLVLDTSSWKPTQLALHVRGPWKDNFSILRRCPSFNRPPHRPRSSPPPTLSTQFSRSYLTPSQVSHSVFIQHLHMTHSSYREAQKSHQLSTKEGLVNQQQSLGSHHAAFQQRLPHSQAPNQVQTLPGMLKVWIWYGLYLLCKKTCNQWQWKNT